MRALSTSGVCAPRSAPAPSRSRLGPRPARGPPPVRRPFGGASSRGRTRRPLGRSRPSRPGFGQRHVELDRADPVAEPDEVLVEVRCAGLRLAVAGALSAAADEQEHAAGGDGDQQQRARGSRRCAPPPRRTESARPANSVRAACRSSGWRERSPASAAACAARRRPRARTSRSRRRPGAARSASGRGCPGRRSPAAPRCRSACAAIFAAQRGRVDRLRLLGSRIDVDLIRCAARPRPGHLRGGRRPASDKRERARRASALHQLPRTSLDARGPRSPSSPAGPGRPGSASAAVIPPAFASSVWVSRVPPPLGSSS